MACNGKKKPDIHCWCVERSLFPYLEIAGGISNEAVYFSRSDLTLLRYAVFTISLIFYTGDRKSVPL